MESFGKRNPPNRKFILEAVNYRHLDVYEYEFVWSIRILTVISEVGMEIPSAFEAILDFLELWALNVVIVNLLGHLIWIYEIPTVAIKTFIM